MSVVKAAVIQLKNQELSDHALIIRPKFIPIYESYLQLSDLILN